MPKYCSLKDYKGYSIKARPVNLRGLFPYWIGNKIKVKIIFKEVSDKKYSNPLAFFTLVEVHANQGYKESRALSSMFGITDGITKGRFETKFISTTIVNTGDFSLYIGDKNGADLKNPLFSTNVMSGDITMANIFLMFISAGVGAGFSFIVGILLGFFDVTKFFQIR